MVFPPSTAPEGEASAEWLSELRRWLHLGRKGVIVMIRDAQPARLRELVEALEAIEPGFPFTTRADAITECPNGSLVLLALREQDFDWLNLNRPQFAQRELRAVLWAEEPTAGAFKFRAPDLHDWVSHFVRCPPGLPTFALEALRVGLRWWPGVAWRGKDLELALARVGIHDPLTLDPSDEFAALTAALAASPSRPIRWVGVDTAHALWRVRWALGWARHHGPNMLDNPAITPAGWFEVSTRQLDVFDATRRLHRAGFPEPSKEAARLELEPDPIEELATRKASVAGRGPDDEAWARVALLRAPAHLQRTLQDHGTVLEARRRLVRTLRGEPSAAWSRFELALFASLERDEPRWPANWNTFRLAIWTIEHSLRTSADTEEQRTIARLMQRMEEYDIYHFLEEHGWDLEERAPGVATALDLDLELDLTDEMLVEPDPWLPSYLGAELGWDAPVATRTLARAMLEMIEGGELATMTEVIAEALHAASSQLGGEDPDYGVVARVVGVGLAVAGDYDRASGLLEHARRVLLGPPELQDSVLTELAMIHVLRGRFTEALDFLASATHIDRQAERVKMSLAAASGARQATAPTPIEPTYPAKEARSYLRRRLHELGHSEVRRHP